MYYNHFREYDPQTGRYTQSDPIGLNDGVNTYAYVGGNPVMFVDPLGLNGAAAGCVIGLWAGPGGCGVGAAIGGAINLLGGAYIIANTSIDSGLEKSTETDGADCEDNDKECNELAKRARGQAKSVAEHIQNDHFHSKPCINLDQTLGDAKAKGCNMSDVRFQFAIGVFNQVCTNPEHFPPPYSRPQGPPYKAH